MRVRVVVLLCLGVLLLAGAALALAQDGGMTPAEMAASADPAVRGEFLFRVQFGCIDCHMSPPPEGSMPDPLTALPTGGSPFPVGPVTVYTSNLTLLGEWTDDQIETAIRYGINEQGEYMSTIMGYILYEEMSDEDMNAMIAYLRTLEPTGDPAPEPEFAVPGMDRMMFATGTMETMDIERARPTVDASDLLARGEYLANVTHCMSCHGELVIVPTLNYVPRPDGLPWGFIAPPLLPFYLEGVHGYDSESLYTALTTGVRPDGSTLMPPMPWMLIALWPQEDIQAIIAWMESMPEVNPADNPNTPILEMLGFGAPPEEGAADPAATPEAGS
jgi:mono/diheme cytochrome c family protein